MMTATDLQCTVCGSLDIEVRVWVKANMDIEKSPLTTCEEDDSVYCPDCDGHTSMEFVDEEED